MYDQVGCVLWEIRSSVQETYCLDSYQADSGGNRILFYFALLKMSGVVGLRYGWIQMLGAIQLVFVSLDLGSAFLLLFAF